MHVHSNRSDGSDSPGQLVEIAAAIGCTRFALTDHDTISGIVEARAAGDELGVEVVAGVELSCHVGDKNVHLLGYFIDITNPIFLGFLRSQRELRDERNMVLCDRLAALGVHIAIEDVLREAHGDAVGRPHFAAALVRNGEAESIQDAFNRFLGADAPTHVVRRDLPAAEAIAAVHAAGGRTSWAHPFTGTSRDKMSFEACLYHLMDAGLDGIEAWYGMYSPDERDFLASTAARRGLVATGGSDYHGTYKPLLALGLGTGDLAIPESAFDELHSRPTRVGK